MRSIFFVSLAVATTSLHANVLLPLGCEPEALSIRLEEEEFDGYLAGSGTIESEEVAIRFALNPNWVVTAIDNGTAVAMTIPPLTGIRGEMKLFRAGDCLGTPLPRGVRAYAEKLKAAARGKNVDFVLTEEGDIRIQMEPEVYERAIVGRGGEVIDTRRYEEYPLLFGKTYFIIQYERTFHQGTDRETTRFISEILVNLGRLDAHLSLVTTSDRYPAFHDLFVRFLESFTITKNYEDEEVRNP